MPLPPGVLESKQPKEMVQDWLSANRKYFIASKKVVLNRKTLKGSEVSTNLHTFSDQLQKVSEERRQRGGADEEFYNKFPRKTEDSKILLSEQCSMIEKQRGICKFCKGPLDINSSTDCDGNKTSKCSSLNERLPGQCYICYEPSYRELPVEFIENANRLPLLYGTNNTSCYEINSLSYSNPLINAPYSVIQGSDTFLDGELNGDSVSPLYGSLHTIQETPLEVYPMHVDISNALSKSLSRIIETLGNGEQDYFIVDSSRSRRKLFKKNEEIKGSDLDLNVNANGELKDDNYDEGRHSEIICIKKYEIEKTADANKHCQSIVDDFDSNINEAVSTDFKMNELNIMRKNEISSKTSEKEIVSIIRIGPQSYLLMDNYFCNSIHNLGTKILVPINLRDGSNIQQVIERCGINFNKKQTSVTFDLKNDMILEEKEEAEKYNGASQDVEGIYIFNNHVTSDTRPDNTDRKSHKSEEADPINCETNQMHDSQKQQKETVPALTGIFLIKDNSFGEISARNYERYNIIDNNALENDTRDSFSEKKNSQLSLVNRKSQESKQELYSNIISPSEEKANISEIKKEVVECFNDRINFNTTCKMDVEKHNEKEKWKIKSVPKFTSELNVESLNKCIVIRKVVKEHKLQDIGKSSLHKAKLEKNKEYPIMLNLLKTNGGKAKEVIKNNGKKNDFPNIGDARKNIQCESSEDALFGFEETTIQVLPLDSEEKTSEAPKRNDANLSTNFPVNPIETDVAIKKKIVTTNPTDFSKRRNLDLSDSYHKYDNANDKWSYVVHYKKNTLANDKTIQNITCPVYKDDVSPDYRTCISLDVADHSKSSGQTPTTSIEKCSDNAKVNNVQIEEKCTKLSEKRAILNLKQTLEQKMKEPFDEGSVLLQNNLDNQHSPVLKLNSNTEEVDMSFKKSSRDEYEPSNSRFIEVNNQLSYYSVKSNKQPFINMNEVSTKIQKFYKINPLPTNELNNKINAAIHSEYSNCPNGSYEDDFLENKPERKLAYTRIMDSENLLLGDKNKMTANLNSRYSTNQYSKELSNANVNKHNKNTNHTQSNSNYSTLAQFSNVIHYQGNLLRQARYTKQDDLSEEEEIKLIGELLSTELNKSSKRQINDNKYPQEKIAENNHEAEMKQQCEENQFVSSNQHRMVFLPKNIVDSCTSPLHSEYSKICEERAKDKLSRLRGGCDKPVIISSLDIGNIALFSNNETSSLLCTDSKDILKRNSAVEWRKQKVKNALIYNENKLGMTIQHQYSCDEHVRSITENNVEGHEEHGKSRNVMARKKRSFRNIVMQTHIDCEDASREKLQPAYSFTQAKMKTVEEENNIMHCKTITKNALHITLPYRHFCGQTKMKTIDENTDALDNENINNISTRKKLYLRNDVTQSCANSGFNKALRPRFIRGQTDLREKKERNNSLDDENLDNIGKITYKRKQHFENGIREQVKSIGKNDNVFSNAKSINLMNITDLRKRTTLSMALQYASSTTEEIKKTISENNIVLDNDNLNNHKNTTQRKQRSNENLSMMVLPSGQMNNKDIIKNNMVLYNVNSRKIKNAIGPRKRSSLSMILQYASPSNETNRETMAQPNLVADNENSNNINRRNELINRNALIKSNVKDGCNVNMAPIPSQMNMQNTVKNNNVLDNVENRNERRKKTTLNMELQYTPSSSDAITKNITRQKKQRNEDTSSSGQTNKKYVVRNNIVLEKDNSNNTNSISQLMSESNENASVQRNLLRERNLSTALHHKASSGKAIKKCIAQNNIVAGKENSINTNNTVRHKKKIIDNESCLAQTSSKVFGKNNNSLKYVNTNGWRKQNDVNSVMAHKLDEEHEVGMELQCGGLTVFDANILHGVSKHSNENAMVGKLDSDPTLRIALQDASCFDQSNKDTIVDGYNVLDDVKSHTTEMKRSRHLSSSVQLSKITIPENNNKTDDVNSNTYNANVEKLKRSVLEIVLFGNDTNSMKTTSKTSLQCYTGQKIKNKRLCRKYDKTRKSKTSNINNIRFNPTRRFSSREENIKVYATNCNKNIRCPNSAVLERVSPKVIIKERACHKDVQCYPFLVVPFIEEESQTEQINSNSDTNVNEANISSSMVCLLNSDDLIELNNTDVNLQEDAHHSSCFSYGVPTSKKASDEYDSYCTICEQLKVATHSYYKNLTSIIPKCLASKLNNSISVENKKNKLIYMCHECNTESEIQQKKLSLCKQIRAMKKSSAETELMCLKCNIPLTRRNYGNNNLFCNDCQPVKGGNKLNKLTDCVRHVNMHLSSSKDETEVSTSNTISQQTDSNKKSLCRRNDNNNKNFGKLSNDNTDKSKVRCYLQCRTKNQKENDEHKSPTAPQEIFVKPNFARNVSTICLCTSLTPGSRSSMSMCSRRRIPESEEKVIQCCTYISSECCNVRQKPRKEHCDSGLVSIRTSNSKRRRNNRHSRDKKDKVVLQEDLFFPKREFPLTASERRREFFMQCMSFYESRRYFYTGKNHDIKNKKDQKKSFALKNGAPWIANPDEYGDMWMPNFKKFKGSGFRTRTNLNC